MELWISICSILLKKRKVVEGGGWIVDFKEIGLSIKKRTILLNKSSKSTKSCKKH
jgi:hypothetical protein